MLEKNIDKIKERRKIKIVTFQPVALTRVTNLM